MDSTSLPRELRDKVRKYAIDFMGAGWRTSTIAHLACVDSEWRDAIETITFQRLELGRKATSHTDRLLFAKYVVGKRQQYLKQLEIALDREAGLQVEPFDDLTHRNAVTRVQSKLVSDLHDIFTILIEWDVNKTGNGSPYLIVSTDYQIISDVEIWDVNPELESMISELPRVYTVAGFVPSKGKPRYWECRNVMDTRNIFSLLSRMPNLRSTENRF